jgi:hypothetical protein
MKPDALIMTTDDNAAAACGVVVWWKFADSVSRATLKTALALHGLAESRLIGDNDSTASLLGRAMQSFTSQHVLCRTLKHGKRWALVNEAVITEEDDFAFSRQLAAGVDAAGQLDFNPADHAMIPEIKATIEKFRGLATRWDLMVAANRMVELCAGVALRPNGGIYYIPKAHEALWASFSAAIAGADAGTCYAMPVMRSDTAVEAVLDALTDEMAVTAAEIAARLAEGNLTTRGIRGQQRAIEAATAKLSAHTSLLNGKLTRLMAKLEELQSSAVVAMLSQGAPDPS